MRFIKEHRYSLFLGLLSSGKLNSYLADIDRQAEDTFFRLVNELAEHEGITEALKANNQMEWVRQMNNVRQRATCVYPTAYHLETHIVL